MKPEKASRTNLIELFKSRLSTWTIACGMTALAANLSVIGANANNTISDELLQMFQQDQSDRQALSTNPKPDQWKTIREHDKQHHDRVIELMNQNKLDSGDDYYYAAMVMQHGDDPKDYMLAHILATAAAMQGHVGAKWLSAASFDRLMQSAGQPQIFGTQYYSEQNEPLTVRKPCDTGVIPDSVRKEFNVPTLAENEIRLEQLNAANKTRKPN